jgi:DNA-directed RNA polymerase subunit M/transcription elongation factor TFIIS
MDFCKFCDNMLYTKIDNDNNMIYHCRNCGEEKNNDDKKKTIKIMEKTYNNNSSQYHLYLNKNIIHDQTLPRINNVECPND